MDPGQDIFDISTIPYFPYSPGLGEWLTLIALTLGILTALFVWRRFNTPGRRRHKAFELLMAEIEALSERPSPPMLSRLSLLARRYLGLCLEKPLHSMTAHELDEIARPGNSHVLNALLRFLVSLDSMRYMRAAEQQSAPDLRELRGMLNEYEKEIGRKK